MSSFHSEFIKMLLMNVLTLKLILSFCFRNRTRNIDVTEINKDIYDAEKAQNKGNNDLESATNDKDDARDLIQQVQMSLISQLPQIQRGRQCVFKCFIHVVF